MAQLLETEEVLRNHIAWKTPADEVAGIVRLVRRQLQGNAQMAMDGVYVAVPNKVWLSAFSQALSAARITCFSPKQLANAMSSTEEMPLEDFGGSVSGDEIGLRVSDTGLVLPCGSTVIWEK